MALRDKYKELIDSATSAGINDLKVREQDNVLYIDGVAPTGTHQLVVATLFHHPAVLQDADAVGMAHG